MAVVIVHCAVCQESFSPGTERCTRCGSNDIMIGTFTPSGTQVSVGRGGTLRVTGRQHETVSGRFLRQTLKEEWSPSRQRMEYVERIVDRVSRQYHEVYYHPV